MTLLHSPLIATDGLVGLWDAKNPNSYPGSGTTWYDLVGGNHVVMAGGVTAPVFNSEGTFTMAQDGFFLNTTANITLTEELTLLSWYYQTATNSPYPRTLECHITGASAGSSSHALAMGGTNDGNIRCWWDRNGTASTRIGEMSQGSINTLNEWHCIVSTKANPAGVLYFDGEVANSNSVAATDLDDINTIAMGNISDNASGYFQGKIAYQAIYNRALTAAEVKQNYDALRRRFNK